jgi:type IV secretory pathway VirB3-like protein
MVLVNTMYPAATINQLRLTPARQWTTALSCGESSSSSPGASSDDRARRCRRSATFMPMPFYHVVIILVVAAYVPVMQNAPAALLPLRQVALHMIVHVVDAHAQNVRNAVFDQRARVTVDGVGVA